MLVALPAFLRLTRVLRQARHEIGLTEGVNEADEGGLQVWVAVERRLEQIGLLLHLLMQ